MSTTEKLRHLLVGGALGTILSVVTVALLKDELRYIVRLAQQGIDPPVFQQSYHVSSGPTPDRNIATALLPLNARVLDFAEFYPLPLTSGGLCVIGNHVYVADIEGAIYKVDTREHLAPVKLELPLPQLNRQEYYRQRRLHSNQVQMEYFRVLDLECDKAGGKVSLYLSHDYYDPDHNTTSLAISSYSLNETSVQEDWLPVFRSEGLSLSVERSATGGRMYLFGDTLLFTIGSFRQPELFDGISRSAMDEVSYGVVAELNTGSGEVRYLNAGFRNPTGLAQLDNGEILVSDHGQRGGDELNRLREGANYGWPLETLGTHYSRYDWPRNEHQGRHEEFEPPVFAWIPSIGTSQLIQLQDFHTRWNNDILLATLKNQTLYRLRYRNGAVLFAEPIWIGERLRDLAELDDHQIALWTDSGKLILLEVDTQTLERGERGFVSRPYKKLGRCLQCHHLDGGESPGAAPSLRGVYQRKIASTAYPAYSTALRSIDENWSRSNLARFIAAPQEFAPGTSMPAAARLSSDELNEIIDILQTLD